MPRGNYWEMTYDPEAKQPDIAADLMQLDGTTGFCDRKIVGKNAKPVQVKTKKSDPELRFERCDFALTVKDSLITNCTFSKCSFDGSKWENVKFSSCKFENCHFSRTSFVYCHFVDSCTFKNNSASAELLRMEDTAISASAFMASLSTNLDHLPPNISADYQRHRLVGTRETIAKTLFCSTRNEGNLKFYFEAYKELICSSLKQKIERHRYIAESRQPVPKCKFLLKSLPARCEGVIVRTAGWLTDWGESLLKAFAFFGIVVLLFCGVYFFYELHHQMTGTHDGDYCVRMGKTLVMSLNISLVAGYTGYFQANDPFMLQCIMIVNLVCGLFWYSLIIPVVTRKTLR